MTWTVGQTDAVGLRRRAALVGMVGACVVAGACDPSRDPQGSSAGSTATTTATMPPTSSTTAPAGGLPDGFDVASVTFVSATTGWALGTAPCGTGPCVQVWRTGDGGRTWTARPAPPVAAPLEPGGGTAPIIRFANADDGWVSADGKLWSTHDGGAHWAEQPVGSVYALEAAAGIVHAVVATRAQDMFAFGVTSSPVQRDDWRPSTTTVPHGAGPVPRAQLVLHGRAGWLVLVNRAVVGGLRLHQGRWESWKPPCDDDGAPVEVAASTASDLVAFCTDGVWNDRPAGERVLVSTDGGATFGLVASPLPVRVHAIAAATPGVWVAGGTEPGTAERPRSVLIRTADGGRTWTTVQHSPQANWVDLGFTTTAQGVVINEGERDRLLMTYDGGQTWRPVSAP